MNMEYQIMCLFVDTTHIAASLLSAPAERMMDRRQPRSNETLFMKYFPSSSYLDVVHIHKYTYRHIYITINFIPKAPSLHTIYTTTLHSWHR